MGSSALAYADGFIRNAIHKCISIPWVSLGGFPQNSIQLAPKFTANQVEKIPIIPISLQLSTPLGQLHMHKPDLKTFLIQQI